MYRSQNTLITPSERLSSIVNAVLSQSQLAPSFLNCFNMMPPCSFVQSQACLRNSSRVRSDFFRPCSASLFTTLASVAIDAWSVPGTQQAFFPSILARLTKMSCMVLFSMWPMCKTPVTLGGGMTMVYGSRPSGLLLNILLSIQYLYHLASTACGSYLLANSISVCFINFRIKTMQK